MNKPVDLAQIEKAFRLTEDALRRGDPDTLAGRFYPLKPDPTSAHHLHDEPSSQDDADIASTDKTAAE